MQVDILAGEFSILVHRHAGYVRRVWNVQCANNLQCEVRLVESDFSSYVYLISCVLYVSHPISCPDIFVSARIRWTNITEPGLRKIDGD